MCLVGCFIYGVKVLHLLQNRVNGCISIHPHFCSIFGIKTDSDRESMKRHLMTKLLAYISDL